MNGAAKMMMIQQARGNNSGGQNEGNRNTRNEAQSYRNEGNYGRMENRTDGRSENRMENRHENSPEGMERGDYYPMRDEAEMRRRRDRRGRYMEADEGDEMRSYGGEMPESRFRDRRGREHYDNGRFALRNGYEEDGAGEREMPRGNLETDYEEEGERTKPHLLGRGGMIGFASHNESKPLDMHTAQEWARRMQNGDGSTGPHWTQEQARSLMTQIGAQGVQPAEFWVALNAMYSDYCKVLKKFGMDRPEIYAELAKAWLDDKDAVPHKAAAYYEHVVKH